VRMRWGAVLFGGSRKQAGGHILAYTYCAPRRPARVEWLFYQYSLVSLTQTLCAPRRPACARRAASAAARAPTPPPSTRTCPPSLSRRSHSRSSSMCAALLGQLVRAPCLARAIASATSRRLRLKVGGGLCLLRCKEDGVFWLMRLKVGGRLCPPQGLQ